ncbi:MAG: hypothetical protein MR413_04020, partial [Clostridia bacterium]|nr:hypothetical protein [Clostridia bacterium]
SVNSSDAASENQLTADNHTSEFITLDKPAIGFTKVGDAVTVTATLADGVEDEVEWLVRDSSMLKISPIISSDSGYLIDDAEKEAGSGKSSSASIVWQGGTGQTSFFARLKSNPEEYVEGTAIFFDNSSAENQTTPVETNDSELKTEFESPEIEEFLRQMYEEGLTQDNSQYDLSLFETEASGTTNSASKTASATTNSVQEVSSENTDEKIASYYNSSTDSIETENNSEMAANENANSSIVSAQEEKTASAAHESAAQKPATVTETEERVVDKVVTETVEDTVTTNVQRETVTTTSVTTSVVGSTTGSSTVTKEVEKQVPKQVEVQVPVQVANEVERQVETTITNEDGTQETVMDTITEVQYTTEYETQYETQYETVTETVTETVEGEKQYDVNETTTIETVVNETVTDNSGNVISSGVVDSSTSTSSRNYTSASMPETGTEVSVSTSVSNSTSSETVTKEVEKVVQEVVTEEVSVEVENNNSANSNTNVAKATNSTNNDTNVSVATNSANNESEVSKSNVSYHITTDNSTNQIPVSINEAQGVEEAVGISEQSSASNLDLSSGSSSETNLGSGYDTSSDSSSQSNLGSAYDLSSGSNVGSNSETVDSADVQLLSSDYDLTAYNTDAQIIESEPKTVVSAADYSSTDYVAVPLSVDSISLMSISPLADPGTTPTEGTAVSQIEGLNTIEIRIGDTRNFETILSEKLGTTGVSFSGYSVVDNRLASISGSGSYAEGYELKGIAEGRTKITANVNGKYRIFNLEVYGNTDGVEAKAVPMVVSNGSYSMALKSDGTLWGWGLIGDSQLGNLKVSGDAQNTPYRMEIKENGKLLPLENIKHIAVGDAHALAVTNDGHVYSWGLNRNAQLGNGFKYTGTNPSYVLTAPETPLTNIKYVAAGNFSSYAITEDGVVYSWGLNLYGQLGNGVSGGDKEPDDSLSTDVKYATKIEQDADGNPFDNIIKVSASGSHALALKNNGDLYAWGSNKSGLLIETMTEETITRPTLYKPNLDGVVIDIAAGGGTNSSGTSGEEGAQELRFHSLVLTSGKNVWTWGYNKENTLGMVIDNENANVTTPTQLTKLPKVISVSASRYNSAAVTENGNVYAWGRNDEGASGNTSVTGTSTREPVLVMAGATGDGENGNLDSVVAVAIGANHMNALRTDGTVYSWGSGMFGQLGDKKNGADVMSTLPVRTGDEESNSLVMEYVIVISNENGEITGEYIGSESIPDVVTITDSQHIKIEIDSIKKYYRTGFNLIKSDKKLDIIGEIQFTSSDTSYATVVPDNEKVWAVVTPVPIENGGKRGIVDIKALNEGYEGVITVNIKEPNEFTTPMVVSGENFTIALKSDGTVWAWGDNTYGQLGNGTYENSQGPIPVLAVQNSSSSGRGAKNLSGIFKVAAGKYHALAMTSDGAVLAWGLNDDGQLGINTSEKKNTPVKVYGGEHSSANGYITLAADIAAGGRHSLVALSTGAVYSWGANDHGQLGNVRDAAELKTERTPVRVVQGGAGSDDGTSIYIEKAIAVAAGENHSLVLLNVNEEEPDMSNAVLIWGANNYGQLGIAITDINGEELNEPYDDAADQIAPEVVQGIDGNIVNIAAIAAGKYHTVLLENAEQGGRVYAFGSNEHGELGRNSSARYINEVVTPEATGVETYVVNSSGDVLMDIVGIAAGGNNTVLIDSLGNVYNFGSNQYGQLGNGTTGSNAKTAQQTNFFNENGQAIASGENSSFVMKKDGYLWSYGFNSTGQLGDLSLEDSSNPVLVGSGAENSLELNISVPDEEGNLSTVIKPNVVTILPNQTITINGGEIRGLRGFNLIVDDEKITKASGLTYASSDESVLTVSGSAATAVSKGSAVVKALASDGTVGMFVVNVKDKASTDAAFYTEPMVVAGDKFSVALKSDGTVWTWGDNESGQLGNGTMGEGTSQYAPVQVVGAEGSTKAVLEKIVAVSAGNSHAVALSYDGTVYTWGSNVYGQLGNGNNGIDSALGVDEEETHEPVEYDETTDTYTIYEAEGIEKIREILDGNFVLGKNIELTGEFSPIGSIEAPFTGVFNGNGYRINGLNVVSSVDGGSIVSGKSTVAGMFAANNGTICNIILTNAAVTNNVYEVDDDGMSVGSYSISGGLVGYNDIDGHIIQSAVLSGTISSYNMSGAL